MDAKRHVGIAANIGDDCGDFVGQRAAVGIAQNHALGARKRGGIHRLERILGVCLVAVEEVLGVKEHAPAALDQKRHRIGNHSEVLFQRRLKHARNMQIPALAHKRNHRGFGVKQGGEVGVLGGADVGAAGAAECGQRGVGERQRFGALEELGVARVGSGPAALDVVYAQIV